MAIATMPVTLVALPVRLAVIVPAEKLPEASRATRVDTVFAVATPVPVGRPLMTGVPRVGLVPKLVSDEPVTPEARVVPVIVSWRGSWSPLPQY